MEKILVIFTVSFLTLLNAQTIAYKCVDTSDSRYWQYFNIDYNSLHFKEGKTMIILYHRKTAHKQGKFIHTFSNNSITFYVTQKSHDFTKIYVTDKEYNYNCQMEKIFSDFTNKYALTNQKIKSQLKDYNARQNTRLQQRI